MWIREVHGCQKPEVTEQDQGHFWICDECGASWIARRGSYTDSKHGKRYYFYLEELSEHDRRTLGRHRSYQANMLDKERVKDT